MDTGNIEEIMERVGDYQVITVKVNGFEAKVDVDGAIGSLEMPKMGEVFDGRFTSRLRDYAEFLEVVARQVEEFMMGEVVCQCEHIIHAPEGCQGQARWVISESYIICDDCVRTMAYSDCLAVTDEGAFRGMAWHMLPAQGAVHV